MANHVHFLYFGLLAGGCVNDATADGARPSAEGRTLPGTGGIMAPPSDPDAAIRSEFAAVEHKDSASAYAIFAQRHPAHPLAREASRRAVALDAKAPHRADPLPCPGSDMRNCDPTP